MEEEPQLREKRSQLEQEPPVMQAQERQMWEWDRRTEDQEAVEGTRAVEEAPKQPLRTSHREAGEAHRHWYPRVGSVFKMI